MSNNFPDGVTRQDILGAIEKYDNGVRQSFADSTDYDLILEDGRRYPPKAIAGIAGTRAAGRELRPDDFSAGEGQKCFRVLRANGFKIVRKHAEEAIQDEDGWTDDELRGSVAAYLEMLAAEQSGRDYSKSGYNVALRGGTLRARSRGSIEFRMQNISATLASLGLPWIKGYKPRSNVGTKVIRRILELLAEVSPSEFEQYLPTTDETKAKRRAASILRYQKLSKPQGNTSPKTNTSASVQFERSPAVRAFVLQEADGTCELCEKPAPFLDEEGFPFLEVHHVLPLGLGGPDTVENAAALCPNCHRELHHSGDRENAKKRLCQHVARLMQVGVASIEVPRHE